MFNKKSKNLHKKLNKLYSDEYGELRWVGNEDWIINSSDVPLPPEVVDIVSLGPMINIKMILWTRLKI